MKLLSLSIVLLSFLTTSCAPVMKKYYVYTEPADQSGKQCLNQCLKIQASCENNRDTLYNQCRSVAVSEYNSYIYTRESQNLPVEKKLSDFDYCVKNQNCQATYNDCYSNCGGNVRVEYECVAFCK